MVKKVNESFTINRYEKSDELMIQLNNVGNSL